MTMKLFLICPFVLIMLLVLFCRYNLQHSCCHLQAPLCTTCDVWGEVSNHCLSWNRDLAAFLTIICQHGHECVGSISLKQYLHLYLIHANKNICRILRKLVNRTLSANVKNSLETLEEKSYTNVSLIVSISNKISMFMKNLNT